MTETNPLDERQLHHQLAELRAVLREALVRTRRHAEELRPLDAWQREPVARVLGDILDALGVGRPPASDVLPDWPDLSRCVVPGCPLPPDRGHWCQPHAARRAMQAAALRTPEPDPEDAPDPDDEP